MQQYQTRVRRMRPSRSDRERTVEDRQSWFRDDQLVQAKAYAEHARQTGQVRQDTEQENGS